MQKIRNIVDVIRSNCNGLVMGYNKHTNVSQWKWSILIQKKNRLLFLVVGLVLYTLSLNPLIPSEALDSESSLFIWHICFWTIQIVPLLMIVVHIYLYLYDFFFKVRPRVEVFIRDLNKLRYVTQSELQLQSKEQICLLARKTLKGLIVKISELKDNEEVGFVHSDECLMELEKIKKEYREAVSIFKKFGIEIPSYDELCKEVSKSKTAPD